MSDVGECKKCGARITRSTTFCRSCNTVFPEFAEISEEGSQEEQPKKTKAPEYQDLTYSSPGYSREEENAKPKEHPTGTQPAEPTPKPELEPKEPEPLEPPTEPELPKAGKAEPAPPHETQTTPDRPKNGWAGQPLVEPYKAFFSRRTKNAFALPFGGDNRLTAAVRRSKRPTPNWNRLYRL